MGELPGAVLPITGIEGLRWDGGPYLPCALLLRGDVPWFLSSLVLGFENLPCVLFGRGGGEVVNVQKTLQRYHVSQKVIKVMRGQQSSGVLKMGFRVYAQQANPGRLPGGGDVEAEP